MFRIGLLLEWGLAHMCYASEIKEHDKRTSSCKSNAQLRITQEFLIKKIEK